MSKNLVKTAWHMARSLAYCTCEKDAFPCIVHAYPAWEVWLEACCIKAQKVKDGNILDLEVGFDPIVTLALATAGMPSLVRGCIDEIQLFWPELPGYDTEQRAASLGLYTRSSELGWRIQIRKAQVSSLVLRHAADPAFELPASFLKEAGVGAESKTCMETCPPQKQATPHAKPRPKKRVRMKNRCRPGPASPNTNHKSAATALRVSTASSFNRGRK